MSEREFEYWAVMFKPRRPHLTNTERWQAHAVWHQGKASGRASRALLMTNCACARIAHAALATARLSPPLHYCRSGFAMTASTSIAPSPLTRCDA